ncbi:putative oxidoreductase [Kordia sp. SMS9]|uniref:SDR family NAD(P)-dependent oxidoreductase n=1 Tax=Kordia sp. SMS9 TaxID=2282170 RepID=UPI000E0DE66B|nr:SDR family NAD(P)-dependent oxidoreductase [Kordia sp. SMS9]AXG68863.1 putative oxidoreductase [Kordia sp. SMS9]
MNRKKIALVTEAGNDLGYKFASILQKQDYTVILAAKGKMYEQLMQQQLENIQVVAIDFTNKNDIQNLVKYIEEAYGKLDVLVNNAEIANGFGQKVAQLNIDEIKELYEENYFSVLQTIQTMHSLLLQSEEAHIVNISSAMGQIENMKKSDFCYGDYQMTAYATAKASLEMLTVLLAKEFKNTSLHIHTFDPILMKNCTHNDVKICQEVTQSFLQLLETHEVSV